MGTMLDIRDESFVTKLNPIEEAIMDADVLVYLKPGTKCLVMYPTKSLSAVGLVNWVQSSTKQVWNEEYLLGWIPCPKFIGVTP